jgi:hypothetical protein
MVSFPNVAIGPSSSSITPTLTGVLQEVEFVDVEDDETKDELVELSELEVVLAVVVVIAVVVVDFELVVAR